jgi:hypothetical protein
MAQEQRNRLVKPLFEDGVIQDKYVTEKGFSPPQAAGFSPVR